VVYTLLDDLVSRARRRRVAPAGLTQPVGGASNGEDKCK